MKDFIEKDIGIPFYTQLKGIIEARINRGDFPDGKISSEHELSRKYGVTVNTVRKALSELKHENKVYKIQGLGTFVNKPKIEIDISKWVSLGRVLKEKGISDEIKVINTEVKDFTEEIYDSFEINNPAKKVIGIERIRLIDNEPIAYEEIYFNLVFTKPLLDRALNGRIHDFVVNELKINYTKIDDYIEPVILRTKTAKLLGTKSPSSGLKITKISYSGDNFIEFSRSTMRGDKCMYHVKVI